MEPLLVVLIWIVIIGVAAAFASWALNYWSVPEPLRKILIFALIVVGVIAVIYLLVFLAGSLPPFPKVR